MKKHALTFAVSFGLAAAILGQAPGGAKTKAKTAPKAVAMPVFKPAAELTWVDLDPKGAPGIKVADVWGDHTSGAFGAFFKFPAGFKTPVHTHTHDIKIVVISGTYTQAPEGKPEVRLGPGSYERQPGGDYRHVSGCDKASECLIFVEGAGRFDLLPVTGATK